MDASTNDRPSRTDERPENGFVRPDGGVPAPGFVLHERVVVDDASRFGCGRAVGDEDQPELVARVHRRRFQLPASQHPGLRRTRRLRSRIPGPQHEPAGERQGSQQQRRARQAAADRTPGKSAARPPGEDPGLRNRMRRLNRNTARRPGPLRPDPARPVLLPPQAPGRPAPDRAGERAAFATAAPAGAGCGPGRVRALDIPLPSGGTRINVACPETLGHCCWGESERHHPSPHWASTQPVPTASRSPSLEVRSSIRFRSRWPCVSFHLLHLDRRPGADRNFLQFGKTASLVFLYEFIIRYWISFSQSNFLMSICFS